MGIVYFYKGFFGGVVFDMNIMGFFFGYSGFSGKNFVIRGFIVVVYENVGVIW